MSCLTARGGRFAGWSLYVKDGVAKYVHNFFDVEYSYVEAAEKLPSGIVNIRYHFNFEGDAPDIGAYEHGGINWKPGYQPKQALFYRNNRAYGELTD